MKREDLFLAIGYVEDSRLLRSELAVKEPSGDGHVEDAKMQKKQINIKRIIRNISVAVLIISMLGVTAYAVGGYIIFDSPEEMVEKIFGNETGYDHSDGGEKYFEDGALAAIEPTFDRAPVDETVAAEEIVPYVSPVGQTISWKGYTLTVDAYLYDSTTECGFVTYLLENPNGLPEYQLQSTGEIWYEGMPDPVKTNQDGYPYIIQEKTTPNRLAVTCYFKAREDTLEINLQSQKRYTPDEFAALIEEDVAQLKQEMTPEEAMETVRQHLGEDAFEQAKQALSEEEFVESCYNEIVARETAVRLEAEGNSEKISVSLENSTPLKRVTAGNGSVLVTPISIRTDITDLEFLHTNSRGEHRIHADNIDSVVIRYQDGTEYTVVDGYILNYVYGIIELPEGNVQTEVFVSPEEDPAGEGYIYVENSKNYCLSTMMFNRIIDVDRIVSVVINGMELPID